MKLYEITIGTGTIVTHQEVVYVEDYECEQNALDQMVDRMENENEMGFFVTDEEIRDNGYCDDEYIIAGNHGLCLYHGGIFHIKEIALPILKFIVGIKEELCRTVEVSATSIEEAKEKVRDMYRRQEIVLDDNDFNNEAEIKVYDEDFCELEEWEEM